MLVSASIPSGRRPWLCWRLHISHSVHPPSPPPSLTRSASLTPLRPGLLRSSLFTTIVQVSSRILLVWGIANLFEAPQVSLAYSSMLVAWSVTEVYRYSYYVTNILGRTPRFLTWLRYNTFFVLYPLGAGSEAWCIYQALDEAKVLSANYYWVLVVILVTYPPGMLGASFRLTRCLRGGCRFIQAVHPHGFAEEEEHQGQEETDLGVLETWKTLNMVVVVVVVVGIGIIKTWRIVRALSNRWNIHSMYYAEFFFFSHFILHQSILLVRD